MADVKRTVDATALLREVVGVDWPTELVQAWVEADRAMQELVQVLPHDLPYAVEPAHVFSPRARDQRK
jgi:hypothetical protein